jgi:lysozyme
MIKVIRNIPPHKAFLGMSAAAALAMGILIKPWEGRIYIAEPDIGGVLTVCDGITGPDVIPGKVYTDPECDHLLAKHVVIHERDMNRSLKRDLPLPTKSAFLSFHYNVGPEAFRRSTLLKLANLGDVRGACGELSRWVFVKGVFVRGLQNRRFSERSLCLKGLDPDYKPPLIETAAGWVMS